MTCSGFFEKEGFKTLPCLRPGTPVDQRYLKAVFSFKDAAREAGLGSIGRHGLLITPRFGPGPPGLSFNGGRSRIPSPVNPVDLL